MRVIGITVLALGLLGCGVGPEDPDETAAPRGAILLHAGHDNWTPSLARAQARFEAEGYTVVPLLMPQPTDAHGPDDDFLGPVFAEVDRLTAEGAVVAMAGISGGGWTTTMATALDARIVRGYSIAGDLPLDLREPYEMGDWEQVTPPLEYREAYRMAEGRLLHIFIWQDSCCFAGVTGDIGTPYVTDSTLVGHAVSDWTIETILADLAMHTHD